MHPTPTFQNPPIVEFVLGVQFEPLAGFTAAHYGRYWDMLGGDWGSPRDNNLISDHFERFADSNRPPKWKLQFEPAPLVNRMTLFNQAARDRLIQVQPTRFHLNWRKTNQLKPSYKDLIDEFVHRFSEFEEFCSQQSLGPIRINQWEVTYVDSFPKADYWQSPNDWHKFLPGLFREKPSVLAESLSLVERNVQWTMEIEPRLGRLHLSSGIGRWKEDQPESLMLNITARGPLVADVTPTYRDGLDLGHRVAVEQFLAMVNPETKQSWGEVK